MNTAPNLEVELDAIVRALPASPRLLAELAPRLRQIEVPLSEIAESLRRDPAITARLIALANSAAYARAEPAISIEEAIACLGFAEVYRLVGALASEQLSDEPLATYGVDSQRFRDNALFVALVMEELAEAADLEPRVAYTVGLLRSIGKVALDRLARALARDLRVAKDTPLLEWERGAWSTTNVDVAARALDHWRFPVETLEAVRHHYAPAALAPKLAHLLNLAAGAADLRGFGFPGEECYWQFAPLNFAAVGVDEGKLVWAGERAFRALWRIRGALN